MKKKKNKNINIKTLLIINYYNIIYMYNLYII